MEVADMVVGIGDESQRAEQIPESAGDRRSSNKEKSLPLEQLEEPVT